MAGGYLMLPETLAYFLYIAGEAEHWDWTPPLEGLRPLTPQDKGRLTVMKKCGLLWVEETDPDRHLVIFTAAGKTLANAHGINLGGVV